MNEPHRPVFPGLVDFALAAHWAQISDGGFVSVTNSVGRLAPIVDDIFLHWHDIMGNFELKTEVWEDVNKKIMQMIMGNFL